MKYYLIIVLVFTAVSVLGNESFIPEPDLEDQRIDMIVDIITLNLKENGWNTILCFGNLPDTFFNKIKQLSYVLVVMNLNEHEDVYMEDTVPYSSNVIIISCKDFKEYEEIMTNNVVNSPYWHPLANIILYYHKREDREIMAKIFFSLWYNKVINTIIVQYDDAQEIIFVSEYTPYVNENYEIQPDNKFGCWTARNLGRTIPGYEIGFICVKKCHNVTIQSKLRANNLGTCIGFNTHSVPVNSKEGLRSLNLFEDRTKDLHGFMFRAYVTEVLPFFPIEDHKNGTYSLHSRDGTIWNTLSKLMNFGIDLSPSVNTMKERFHFEVSIDQIFAFARRKGDLCLFPIYQFDIAVVEIDLVFAYKDSGICFLSSRAEFQTTIFDVKNLEANYDFIARFLVCFICIWATFSIFKTVEKSYFSFDQLGRDLLNTCRNVLLINLCKPPNQDSFRIFLAVSLWSFFIINFVTQATITSFFTAGKRGKEVDTFEDIIEKGYPIEGMASPDVILPDTEEKFRIINSRLVSEQDIFGCVKRMDGDNHRFCLLDCSVGRYIVRNWLNKKGEQYLHIAQQDRIHSHYLTMVMYKHSPLTERFKSYMMQFFEAGLIRKWEQYRYTDIKDEVTTKSLRIEDLSGIFEVYVFCVGITLVVFVIELATHYLKTFSTKCLKLKMCCKMCKATKKVRFGKLLRKRNTE